MKKHKATALLSAATWMAHCRETHPILEDALDVEGDPFNALREHVFTQMDRAGNYQEGALAAANGEDESSRRQECLEDYWNAGYQAFTDGKIGRGDIEGLGSVLQELGHPTG